MDKRDRFLAKIRAEAKARALPFRVEKGRGKGGHAILWVGQKWTTLPGRDIDPKTASKSERPWGWHRPSPSIQARADEREKSRMALRTFTYRAQIEPGDETGFVVSFRDIPEAITEGATREEAVGMAADALGLALLVYAREGRPFPIPRAKAPELTKVTVEPEVAAKLALLEAFERSGLTKTELGRRLGKDEKEVRRILDPMHNTKLSAMKAALAILGQRLVVGFEELAA